ncbi:class III lanthionine synthetase LanKC [Luteimonas sp. A501]
MRDLNLHPDFFIPYSARKPSDDYLRRAHAALPHDWRLRQDYFWTQAIRPVPTTTVQGWKIHVSSTVDQAMDTLGLVAPVCIAHDTEFKFASDPGILRHLLGKSCKRSQSGKFITIYPQEESTFVAMLEALHAATHGIEGPYVLSDRQYRDSTVVYYRYGGFIDISGLNGRDGTACILNDRFQLIEDVRSARFTPPAFVGPVPGIEDEPGACTGEGSPVDQSTPDVFGGAYRIDAAIKFSNFGGVYIGESFSDGTPVIIKEARPFVGSASGPSAADSLRREFRLLTLLAGSGIAPEPLGLFQEWTHLFLAQERIPGHTLREHQARTSKLVHSGTTDVAMRNWIHQTATIARNLIEVVARLHERSIVFGDLSTNNVIVDAETQRVRLIDFEGAYEVGVDPPVNLFTPGFGRPERLDQPGAGFVDDVYAVGCILVAMMMPNTAVMALKPSYARELLDELRRDIGLPTGYAECALGLLSGSLSLDEAAGLLEHLSTDGVVGFERPPQVAAAGLAHFCTVAASGVASYCLAHMDLSRSERVFPAGSRMDDAFALDQGMAGIARAVSRITGAAPTGFEEWYLGKMSAGGGKRRVGLLDGASGTAWVLAEFGRDAEAKRELRKVGHHRSLFEDMSLGHGTAGYGYTCLKFWLRYGEASWLAEAEKMGEVLCSRAMEVDSGVCWTSPDDDDGAPIGLHEGGAGIALFLLYLHCVTGKQAYLDTGASALAFDVAAGRISEESLGFPRTSKGSILYPYIAFGSAGVGTVALRYYAVTGRTDYADLVRRTLPAVSNKYAVGAGLYLGLAGLGNYLLDAAEFLGDPSLVERAHRCASGIRVFAVEREDGIAFPDANGLKLNCDYASGSAGIAMFLHRLANGGGNFDLMIDEALRCDSPRPAGDSATSMTVAPTPRPALTSQV